MSPTVRANIKCDPCYLEYDECVTKVLKCDSIRRWQDTHVIHDLRLACQTNDLFGSVLKAVESVQWEAALCNLYEGVSHGQ